MFNNIYLGSYFVILFLGALTGLVLFRRVSAPLKWLAFLLVSTLINELIARYFKYTLRSSNSPVYNIFTFVEFTFFYIIYKRSFEKVKKGLILNACLIIFLIFGILNILFLQPYTELNTNTILLENLLLVFLSLLFFLTLRSNMEIDNLFQEAMFWFNCGVFVYYSIELLVFGLQSLHFYAMKDAPLFIYSIFRLLNGLFYLILMIALIIGYKYRFKQMTIK